MSSIAERIAQLTPEQRKLIALRRQKQAEQKTQEDAIVPLKGEGPWEASVDQTALWFIHKLNPDGKGYNISSCQRMQGPMDPDILQKSFDHIVARQEILRTTFTEIDGKPYQVVHESMPTPIVRKDVSHLPEDHREEAARAEIAAFVTPFDHETGPLVRLHLIKLDDEDHVLQAMFDHTTIDWWSFQIFFHELWVGYVAYNEGHAPDLPPMPIQFRDFAAWRNRWLESDDYRRSIDFWKKKLEGAPTLLDLPTDRPRPATPSYRGALHRVKIPAKILDRLRLTASQANCSPIMSLLATTFAFLSRYTGVRDLLIGTTITNRDREETHLMMGYLLNMLIMRGRLEDNPSFLELMEQTRRTVLEAFDHKEVPFRKLVEELNPERDLSRMPLYQVEFIYVTTGGPTIAHQKSSDLATIPTPFSHQNFEYDRQTSAIDLQIAFSENPYGMDLLMEYTTDIFHAETIRRMGHLIIQLLDSMLTYPDQPILDIPWLTEGDKKQLVVDWNQTEKRWPDEATTLAMIQNQAAQTPQAPACRAGGQTLCYRDLMTRASAIAAGLKQRGIANESRIGVHLERGPELLPLLLGIWQAGAAYVPLDPTHPQERLRFIADDAGLALIVTDPSQPCDLGVTTATCQALAEAGGTAPATNPLGLNAAYLIYTSGSTGRPKGVTVSHGALANFLRTMAEEPGFKAGEKLLAVTTLAFDIAGLELYLPLTQGGTVVLADSQTSGDGQLLAQMLETEHIDVMQATPATWRLLYESGWQGRRGMRVFCGGEALPEDLAQNLRRDSAEVWNLYGPTETTIWSTRTQVRMGEPVHLGHPIANTQTFAVDASLDLAPAGVPGELLIGGQGLARGYWQRPGLTASRFVPNPFSDRPGERLYRTGDLVKHRPDGSLLFLGRIDFQVKIRGYRIELGEIANVLAQHDAIEQAVVTARQGAGGDQLVAYYLADAPLDSGVLRDFASNRLPSYMVPAFFVHMEAWPLTPNGKINRRALPKPDAQGQRAEFVAPRSDMERNLADIWKAILDAEPIGIHDSFFLLGGHSLLATQVAARVRDEIGRELPLKAIFDHPTVAELAEFLDHAKDAQQRPPMKLVARGQEYPLSFSQERIWFLDKLEGAQSIYNMPIPLTLKGQLNRPVLEKSLQHLLKRHESFRTRFLDGDAGPVQVIAAHQDLTIEFKDLGRFGEDAWEAELHPHLTAAATQTFDLANGPVIRFYLFRTAEDRHHLLVVMHHIISDGWSLGVMLRELAALYRAFADGQASPLDELRFQYVDYASWQRSWLDDGQMEETMAFWQKTLADAPSELALPYDYPRPQVQTYHGRVHDFWMDRTMAENLEALSRRTGVTPFMTLLAAYAVLLNRYSHQADLCIGTPVANRNNADAEAMIGLFINTLVLRLDLDGNPSFATLLERIRETTLTAFSHQDAPFEKVVEAVDPDRNTSMTPLFQTLFSFETLGLETTAAQSLPGLDMNVMDIELSQAKFDLSLHTFLSGGMLRGNFEYNTDLFRPETIAQLAEHYTRVLQAVCQSPDTPIAEIEIMTAAERQTVVHDWNQTRRSYDRDQAIQNIFEDQVRQTPQAPAIADSSRTWTYRQTANVANQYAQALREAGVGYQDVVALTLPPCAETIALILAIVKVGAVYMPIDNEVPLERIEYMVNDAKAKLLVGEAIEGLKTGLTAWMPPKANPDQETAPPPCDHHSLQTAYLIYTSGSTGNPKGVVVNHRNVLRLVQNNTYADVGPKETVLQGASLAFDAATFEIWASLLNGGRVVIHPSNALDLLPQTLQDGQVSTAWLTAQLFNMLLDEHPEAFTSLRQVLAGGEALSPDHVKRFLKANPDKRLINGYGPTESTTFACCANLSETGLTPMGVAPIGTPIANTTAYILDPQMRPVPAGVFGELFLGGDGLATCYLNRAGRTAQSFVPNPFAAEDRSGDRLYRTGDRVRWLDSGLLEFGGRLDRQVKLRGYRLELGEIESCLRGLEKVRACAVRLDESQNRIVAYLVGPNPDDLDTLRDQVTAKLPSYMVPAGWALLPELPLTSNGKLDWRTLRETPITSDAPATFEPPETEMEIAVAAIWAELLKLDKVGKQDNFFTRGGHSLIATRAIARIRDRLGLEVPLQSIFQYPTLCDFARYLDIGRLSMDASDEDDEDMEEGTI